MWCAPLVWVCDCRRQSLPSCSRQGNKDLVVHAVFMPCVAPSALSSPQQMRRSACFMGAATAVHPVVTCTVLQDTELTTPRPTHMHTRVVCVTLRGSWPGAGPPPIALVCSVDETDCQIHTVLLLYIQCVWAMAFNQRLPCVKVPRR